LKNLRRLPLTFFRKEEQERQITIKSTGISLHYVQDSKEYIINLVDRYLPFMRQFLIYFSPGHVDFSSEVTAALRITDGALIVVDCIEGVCVQTEVVTRQALGERIKPVLHVNKVDRGINELQLDAEALYQKLNDIVSSVNSLMTKYEDEALGDVTVDPRKGNVSFGSGKQGWAFTLPLVAQKLAERTGRPVERILKYLWGDYFYDPAQKRCVRTSVSPKTGDKLTRYVCQVLFKPLISIYQTVKDENSDYLFETILPAIHVTLTASEKSTLRGNDLVSRVLQLWLPAGDALVSMVIDHLPSPVQAQKYRVETLYTGPADDEVARAIRNCDPDGPLTVFISKMVPSTDGDRFFAFGRVFSGTARPQSEVYIMNPDYIPGFSKEVPRKKLQRVVLMMGRYIENVDAVPCGTTLGIAGIDNFLTKSGTLSSVPNGYPIAPMKFSVAPVVRRALSVDNPANLPEFVKALKKLSKVDPCLQVITKDSTGECIIAGAGELHIEVALTDLHEFLGDKIEFTVSDPLVEFQETISTESRSIAIVKSPNKHNRLFITAEPLAEVLCKAIEAGEVDTRDTTKKRDLASTLVSKFGWNKQDAGRLWAFSGTNCLVDASHGVQYLQEIREHVVAAFEWVIKEGMLAGEPISGVRFNLLDATLHADAIHRGAGQLIPTARRGFYAAFCQASPELLEPVFLAEIVTEQEVAAKIHPLVMKLRGYVIDEQPKEGTPLYIVKAHIPVLESFGFSAAIRGATGGRAFPQLLFDHWQSVSGDPTDPASKAGELVQRIRERKGLPSKVPGINEFL
jgi:elongation factor 2